MRDNDAPEIKRALTDRLESVIDHYFPGTTYRGGSAFPEPKGAHDLGSFEVYMHGPRRGEWFRRSQGIGGDVVNLVAYAITGDHKAYREAFAEAKAFLGMAAGKTHPRPSQPRPAPVPEKSSADNREHAFKLWKASKPIPGTLAERYLKRRVRGLDDLTPFQALRFHPALRYDNGEFRGEFPALVAAVTGPSLKFLAVWRIYLVPSGEKASVPNPKLGLGPAKGGAVWLAGEGSTVNVCEGIETGFGVRGFRPGERVACSLSTSGMKNFEPPGFVKSVLIWPDGDRNRIRETAKGEQHTQSPGLAAAEALKARMDAQGIPCSVQPAFQNGKDALDSWNEWHALKESER